MSKKKSKKQTCPQEENYLQKDLEYYKTLLTLWVENRMTSVKMVLNLSAGGIGLLVTFSHYFKVSYGSFIFVVGSIVCFCFSILCCLAMYYINPKYLENELAIKNIEEEDDDDDEKHKKLERLEKSQKNLGSRLDFLHKASFILLPLAVLLFSIMGFMEFRQNYEKNMKEKEMSSTEKKRIEKIQVTNPASDSISLNAEGFNKMRPNASGISKMRANSNASSNIKRKTMTRAK